MLLFTHCTTPSFLLHTDSVYFPPEIWITTLVFSVGHSRSTFAYSQTGHPDVSFALATLFSQKNHNLKMERGKNGFALGDNTIVPRRTRRGATMGFWLCFLVCQSSRFVTDSNTQLLRWLSTQSRVALLFGGEIEHFAMLLPMNSFAARPLALRRKYSDLKTNIWFCRKKYSKKTRYKHTRS